MKILRLLFAERPRSACPQFVLVKQHLNSTSATFAVSPCLQKFFGDEYYGGEEEEKPQFNDDDEVEGKRVFYVFYLNVAVQSPLCCRRH